MEASSSLVWSLLSLSWLRHKLPASVCLLTPAEEVNGIGAITPIIVRESKISAMVNAIRRPWARKPFMALDSVERLSQCHSELRERAEAPSENVKQNCHAELVSASIQRWKLPVTLDRSRNKFGMTCGRRVGWLDCHADFRRLAMTNTLRPSRLLLSWYCRSSSIIEPAQPPLHLLIHSCGFSFFPSFLLLRWAGKPKLHSFFLVNELIS